MRTQHGELSSEGRHFDTPISMLVEYVRIRCPLNADMQAMYQTKGFGVELVFVGTLLNISLCQWISSSQLQPGQWLTAIE